MRSFAAQAAGFLLRSCPPEALRAAVRCLVAEQASRPDSWERTQVWSSQLPLAAQCL